MNIVDLSWFKTVPTEPNPCPDCGAERGYRPDFILQAAVPNQRCEACKQKRTEAGQLAGRAEYIVSFMLSGGVPQKFINISMELPEDELVKEAVQKAIDGRSLIILGKVGRGKTTLAVHIYKSRLLSGATDIGAKHFWPARDLCAYVRDGIDSNKYEARLEECAKTPFMILDDMGKERITDNNKNIIMDLIAMRYEQRRQTIITTNLDGKGLLSRYDDRTLSRMRGMLHIEIVGTDRRQAEEW
jgi:Cdc6-like AAA superfamily ATPase